MQIIKTPAELNAYAAKVKSEGKTVGLVPTMGYLHEGHKSLIRKSSEQNDVTIVSVFVNPTQFGPSEDLETYPRDLERDKAAAEQAGADVIFHPEPEDMYPKRYGTYVSVDSGITKILCGKTRPGHFRGVATVVTKLFNISMADRAYFGQKDAQQLAVIMRMVSDLNMNIEIVPCPIVREADGLAMSSRNTYLSAEERSQALSLSAALKQAEDAIKNGRTNLDKIKRGIRDKISEAPLADIEYVESVTFPELEPCGGQLDRKTLIALAVRFGTTRLIDNIIVSPNQEG